MTRRPFAPSRRQRLAIAALLLGCSASSFALNTATIVTSTLSPDCLEYRVTGICYWLYCTWTGCTVRTSVKVRHYIPDAVVSSYSNTGENPWVEVRAMSLPNPTAKAGGDGTTNEDHENNLAKFKNADVIGHPGGHVFSQFASASGYTCEGAGTAFMPYLLSTLDTLAWRYNIPEALYPEALIPGRREIGTRTAMNLWGNVYPRGGFLHQVDDDHIKSADPYGRVRSSPFCKDGWARGRARRSAQGTCQAGAPRRCRDASISHGNCRCSDWSDFSQPRRTARRCRRNGSRQSRRAGRLCFSSCVLRP